MNSDETLEEFFGVEALMYLWQIEKDALKAYINGGTYESVALFFKITRQAAHTRIKKILKVARFYQNNLANLVALEVICDLLENDNFPTKDEWLILREVVVERKTGACIARKYKKTEGWVSVKLSGIRAKIKASGSEEFYKFVNEYSRMKELRSLKYYGRKKT